MENSTGREKRDFTEEDEAESLGAQDSDDQQEELTNIGEDDLNRREASNVARYRPSTETDGSDWNQMFFELMLYKAVNGNLNVKAKEEGCAMLHKWILQQRKEYRAFQKDPDTSLLTAERIKVLESIKFTFATRGDGHWQRNFEKLQRFRSIYGHVLVPRQSDIPGLGDWVRCFWRNYSL